MLEDWQTAVEGTISSPPDTFVNHSVKVCPVFVRAGKVTVCIVESYFFFELKKHLSSSGIESHGDCCNNKSVKRYVLASCGWIERSCAIWVSVPPRWCQRNYWLSLGGKPHTMKKEKLLLIFFNLDVIDALFIFRSHLF